MKELFWLLNIYYIIKKIKYEGDMGVWVFMMYCKIIYNILM